MNNIERQLLTNQVEIMNFLLYPDSPSNTLFLQKSETHKLLRVEEKEEPCCEMPPRDDEFAISKDGEDK